MFFPISKLNCLSKKFFSVDKLNLLCLFKKDYGNGNDFHNWIYNILTNNHINDVTEIVLVTHPRTLGYVFNPVSFWLCFDEKQNLKAVVSEVNNTCGQKHSYLCYKSDHKPIDSNEWIKAEKQFYVSPFMKVEGGINFVLR